MTIVTRFAPSPTGYLHIGGARTALFNYLFAKANKGKFLLRIEDTDKERSTEPAINAIVTGLKWLNIDWDEQVVFQSKQIERHKQAALSLVEQEKAYYCFTPQSEIDEARKKAIDNKQHFIFKSNWRDVDSKDFPSDIKPVIRLKAPRLGDTIIDDKLQGKVVVANDHLDDMVLLRSDGTPTYMLAVVIDDHDMGITHIIRGDDHLTNAARQILIYQAFGWQVPVMVHIPLIHGSDGAKLSKRHGALGVEAYKEMGYLPDALCNYLLRLGWAHGDDEIISRDKAIEWFNLEGLGKAPSKLDFAKMKNLNAHYLRKLDNKDLSNLVVEYLRKENIIVNKESESCIIQGMDGLKMRAELISDLATLAKIYLLNQEVKDNSEAAAIITNHNKNSILEVIDRLTKLELWNKELVEATLKNVAVENNMKVGELMMPLRALITGMTATPSVYEIIAVLGRDEVLKRLNRVYR
jgi:glutamyl-tRNA synthetase